MEKYKEEVKKDHVKSGVDIGWGRPGKCGNLPIFIKTQLEDMTSTRGDKDDDWNA
jgi:hypothetical protein